jgi:hypothetical protein
MMIARAVRNGRVSLGIAAAVLVALAGCGDPTAPWSRFDPDEALYNLDEVSLPLDPEGDLLLGLNLVVITLEYHGSGALGTALSLQWAGPEQLAGRVRPLKASPRRDLRGDRDAGGLAAEGAIAGLTLPWAFTGETMAWDPVDGYVPSGLTGAPTHGVRFILYRMDPLTGYPLRPLSPLGHLDILDEDGAAVEAVRVRAVRTSGVDRVIADYRVTLAGSGSDSEGSMEIGLRGVVGEVGTVELDLVQRWVWSRSRDREEMVLDYLYRRGSSRVELEGRATSGYEAAEWATFDFETRIRGGYSTTEIEASISATGSLRGDVRSDGRRVARIDGHDGSPRFERSDGGHLSWSEEAVLEQIWTGITDLIWLTDWVMAPADLLVLSG